MLFNVLFVVLMLYAIVAPCVFIKFGMMIAEKVHIICFFLSCWIGISFSGIRTHYNKRRYACQ